MVKLGAWQLHIFGSRCFSLSASNYNSLFLAWDWSEFAKIIELGVRAGLATCRSRRRELLRIHDSSGPAEMSQHVVHCVTAFTKVF